MPSRSSGARWRTWKRSNRVAVGPELGEQHAREVQVPRLFLAVVAVDLADERVGVGMLGRELLEQVRDLFAR